MSAEFQAAQRAQLPPSVVWVAEQPFFRLSPLLRLRLPRYRCIDMRLWDARSFVALVRDEWCWQLYD